MGITSEDIFYFTKEFTALLNSGSSEVSALEHIELQAQNRELQRLIRKSIESMKGGYPFSESLRKCRKELPLGYIETVSIGEETSSLTALLSEYTDMLGKWINIKQKILQICIYPAILFTVSGLILISVSSLSFLLPSASPALAFYYKYLGLGAGIICLGTGLMVLLKIPVYKLGNIFPALRNIIIFKCSTVRNLYLMYIGSVLSTLLKGGVSLQHAVKLLQENNFPSSEKNVFALIYKNLSDGISVHESFINADLFPEFWAHFIREGGQNNLASVFQDLQHIHFLKTRYSFNRLFSFLKPLVFLSTLFIILHLSASMTGSIFGEILGFIRLMISIGGDYAQPDHAAGKAVAFILLEIISIGGIFLISFIWASITGYFERGYARGVLFLTELKHLLTYNVPFEKTIGIIGTESSLFNRKFRKISDAVAEGIPIAEALRLYYPRVLPCHIWDTVITGIETGNIDSSLESALSVLEAGHKETEFFWNRLIYSSGQFVVLLPIQQLIAWAIIPKFNCMFEEMGIDLPLFSRLISWTFNTIVYANIVLSGCIAAMIILVILRWIGKKDRIVFNIWEKIFMTVPFLGKAYRNELISSFFSSAGLLLEKGLSEKETVVRLKNIHFSPWLERKYTKIFECMEQGYVLSEAAKMVFKGNKPVERYSVLLTLRSYDSYIPALKNMADIIRTENEIAVVKAGQIIPPVILIMYGILLGFFAISVFYPFIAISQHMVLW